MDAVTLERINKLHPKVREEVKALVELCNQRLTGRAEVRIVQGLRTIEEQDALYAKGRTNKSEKKVTNAKGGQSIHNYGLAVDFCLLLDGKEISWDLKKDWDGDKIADWMEVVKIFRDAGWVWGGTWKFTDNPHFEKTFNNNWQSLFAKVKANNFISGTKYVNI